MKNVFDKSIAESYIDRINLLDESKAPAWGKMNAGQMLAHCNVTYEMALTDQHPMAKGLKKFMLKLFVKPIVVGDKPYKKNSPTATEFKVVGDKKFDAERKRLTDFISEVQVLGADHFDGKESNSFGELNKKQWNTMFAKHLDHHLEQFGV